MIYTTLICIGSQFERKLLQFFSQPRRPVSCMLVNDASHLTFICFTAANYKIKTPTFIAKMFSKIQNKLFCLFSQTCPRSKMAHTQNGPIAKRFILKMAFLKMTQLKICLLVGNGPDFKLLLMKKVRKFKAFASLCKIIRQPQASNTPLCHKTTKHSNECGFCAMQTDEFGVSDFIGSSCY